MYGRILGQHTYDYYQELYTILNVKQKQRLMYP